MSKAVAIQKLNEKELELGLAGTSASWHQEHISSPTIYIGGLPPAHDEANILAMFEQYGTIVHLNLVRHIDSNKSKQFAFAMYADPRSAILAIDNLNAIQVNGFTLRVDHVDDYRVPEPADTFDTTPRSHTQSPSQKQQPQSTVHLQPQSDEPGEHLREEAVMQRLRRLRKRRRVDPAPIDSQPAKETSNEVPKLSQNRNSPSSPPTSPPPDTTDATEGPSSNTPAETDESRQERRQRRLEKEKRRAQRAAIRQARAERRARRQQNEK